MGESSPGPIVPGRGPQAIGFGGPAGAAAAGPRTPQATAHFSCRSTARSRMANPTLTPGSSLRIDSVAESLRAPCDALTTDWRTGFSELIVVTRGSSAATTAPGSTALRHNVARDRYHRDMTPPSSIPKGALHQ